jgi:hypothetical protein
MVEMDVNIHTFLTLALNAGERSIARPGRFALEEITPLPTE